MSAREIERGEVHARGIRFARGLVKTVRTALEGLAKWLEETHGWFLLKYVYAGKETALALEQILSFICKELGACEGVDVVDEDIAVALRSALSRFRGGEE